MSNEKSAVLAAMAATGVEAGAPLTDLWRRAKDARISIRPGLDLQEQIRLQPFGRWLDPAKPPYASGFTGEPGTKTCRAKRKASNKRARQQRRANRRRRVA